MIAEYWNKIQSSKSKCQIKHKIQNFNEIESEILPRWLRSERYKREKAIINRHPAELSINPKACPVVESEE